MSEAPKEEKPKQISLKEKWKKQMILIEEKTGIKGIYVVILLILSVICVYLNIFDTIITNLVGTLYPAFWTIKSIENNALEEQKNWLIYWAVFGSFVLMDMFSPIIVKFIPVYFVMKIMLLIWLLMPGSYGCIFVYNLIVKKIIRKYENKMDKIVNNIEGLINEKSKINEIIKKLKKRADLDIDKKVAQEIQEEEKNKKIENN